MQAFLIALSIKVGTVLYWLTFLGLLLVSCLTLPFLSQTDLWFELNHDRTPYYLLGWGILLIFSVWKLFHAPSDSRLRCGIAVAFSFIFLCHFGKSFWYYHFPLFIEVHQQAEGLADGTEPSVLLAYAGEDERLQELYREHQPSVMIVVGRDGDKERRALGECQLSGSLEDGTSIAIAYSAPCDRASTISLGDDVPPVFRVDLPLSPTVTLPLFFFRALLESNSEQHYRNHLAVRRLTTMVRHEPLLAIIASLHSTPFSDHYGRLTFGAELFDASWGRGYSSNIEAPWWAKLRVSDAALYRGYIRASKFEWLPSTDGKQKNLLVRFDLGRAHGH